MLLLLFKRVASAILIPSFFFLYLWKIQEFDLAAV